ncbi:hypothetical protein ACQP3F_27600 [Escherichia coli]
MSTICVTSMGHHQAVTPLLCCAIAFTICAAWQYALMMQILKPLPKLGRVLRE